MCKRTMYKRARIPMFYDAHAPTVVPRPFFLAPAKTAWELERGWLRYIRYCMRAALPRALRATLALCARALRMSWSSDSVVSTRL